MAHKEKQNRNEQNSKHSLTTTCTNAKQKLTYYFTNINQNHFNQFKDTDASKYPSLYCVRQCVAELNPKFSVQPLPNNKGFKKT